MAVQDYKINYKSDFVLTINGDAGWAIQFCIKFWTGMPSQAYFVGFDGVKYVNCRVGDTPTQLLVMFDDHHLPIGPLRMQIAYHTTIEEFPGSVFDEVTNARDVIVTIDGTDYQVMLDFTGEDSPELEFNLPAYANEAERIQNELQRQQNEADRIAAELQREQATAAAVQGAENVNAQLNGSTLTVTNRNGVSTSVNTKGEQGEQGPAGPEGPQGDQGVSIVSFRQVYASETATYYSIAFSDGHEQSVAIPKGAKGDTGATGPTGPQGPQGDTGVSITGFVETGETETATLYNITFSNGTTQQVSIPKGEKGDQGPVGPQGPQGPMGDVAVITPEQQAAFTMYSVPGQNTDGPMTQKAVTDNFAGINTDDDADLDIADDNGNVLVRFNDGHVQTKNFDSKQLPAIATKNTEDYDFTIEDEAGDAIVLFQHGHVRTKNFNSETFSAANYLKDKFQGKKIAIVGDSICTYQGWLPSDVAGFSGTAYATYYPHGDVDAVGKTWWYQMALTLGIDTSNIANTSWSGGTACGDSTSTTFGKPACSTKRINDIAIRGFIPDIIIVSVGGNDWGQCGLSGYSTTPGTWKESDPIPAEGTIHGFRNAYALILAKIQQTYPLARVFCCTMLDDWRRDGAQDDASDNVWPPNNQYKGDYVAFSTSKNYLIGDKVSYSGSYYEFVNNHFAGAWNANDVTEVTPKGITICEWNNHIREIANAFGCDVIDMHKCGITYFNIPSLAVDGGLHPNAAGHAMMARKAASELMSKY
jgi:lysophospholipase L1-like esterase